MNLTVVSQHIGNCHSQQFIFSHLWTDPSDTSHTSTRMSTPSSVVSSTEIFNIHAQSRPWSSDIVASHIGPSESLLNQVLLCWWSCTDGVLPWSFGNANIQSTEATVSWQSSHFVSSTCLDWVSFSFSFSFLRLERTFEAHTLGSARVEDERENTNAVSAQVKWSSG